MSATLSAVPDRSLRSHFVGVRAAPGRRLSPVLIASAAIAALLGCERPAGDAPPARSPPDSSPTIAQPRTAWVRSAAVESPFRAFAWGAGDTLWGIVRGRVAYAAGDGTVRRLNAVAWDVQAAPDGTVSWTDERGLHVRTPQDTRTVQRPLGLGNEYTGPEVLWSPDGRRALLTWTGEGGTRHSLLDGAAHRLLAARVAGYMSGSPALWLNGRRVLLPVTAIAGRGGEAEHRESGYRGDIAVLDVDADSMWLVTSAADGEYLVLEGLLHPDTVLVGIRRESAMPAAHVAIETRTWRQKPRLEVSGVAAAARGVVAVLRPLGDAAAERTFELLFAGPSSTPVAADTITGHAVRLLWHPAHVVLAVAVESEQRGGIRTLLFERQPR